MNQDVQNPAGCRPGRRSVKQPPFRRVRPIGSPLYPSYAYDIPEKGCISHSGMSFKSDPIQFVGVDIVEFDENDPTTVLTILPSIVITLLRGIICRHVRSWNANNGDLLSL